MTTGVAVQRLRFMVGARTLATIPRRLVRVPWSLDAVLGGSAPILPVLPGDADGYLVTSLPMDALARIDRPELIASVRQHYVRYHIDLTSDFDRWFAALSGSARSGLKRKAKRLAASQATVEIRAYVTPADLAVFHPLARTVSAKTYQARLLDAGLPDDAASLRHLSALAAADRLRAWLLMLDDVPIAYLCCTADGTTLRYDHVGHDPAYADISPGAMLQMAAMRQLFAERRFARFDFTEGEGQHKRQFASAGTPCIDLLLLRPTVANRLAIAALRTFDATVARAKRATTHPALARLATRLRR